jgi:hypothetical protein
MLATPLPLPPVVAVVLLAACIITHFECVTPTLAHPFVAAVCLSARQCGGAASIIPDLSQGSAGRTVRVLHTCMKWVAERRLLLLMLLLCACGNWVAAPASRAHLCQQMQRVLSVLLIPLSPRP